MKRLALLVSVCGFGALATSMNSTAQEYETYLDILEGSVICRQGIAGPGGPLLSYVAWLTDPDGATVAQDEKQTYYWRLDGQYQHEPSISGTYTCRARFYADAALVAELQQSMPVYTKPTGETIASGGWGGESDTIHKWNQTLTGAGSFAGRWVTEVDPGGGGPDYCWFPGSNRPPFTAVTTPNYLWQVNTGNTWGPDNVGWYSDTVTYYRNQGRAPCYTTFPQRMEISMQPSGGSYVYEEYVHNLLGAGIGVTTVWSGRSNSAGWQFEERAWP